MNDKKMIQGLLIGLLLILSAMFVSGAYSTTVSAPTASSFNAGAITVTIAVFEDGVAANSSNNLTNITVQAVQGATIVSIANITNSYSDDANFNLTNATYSFAWATSNGSYPDGTWVIRVNVTGNLSSSSEVNSSQADSSSFTIDNTAPNSSTSLTDDSDNTVGGTVKVDYGTAVNINCNVVDSTAGLVTANNTISIKFPGLSTYENLSLTANDATNLKAVVKADQTRTLGDYSIRCFSWDKAGNSNLSEFNFTTKEVVIKSGGSAGIPGFENPVGKVKVTSGVHTVKEKLTAEGISFLLKKSASVRLDINADYHSIEVKSLSSDIVTVMITSNPIELTIAAGESESVDLNGDGISDLEVTFHKLFANTYADMTFKLVETPVETVEEDTSDTFDTAIEEDTYKSPKGGLTVTLAVIVIVLIIGYALIRGKKK